ncbi:Nucleoside-diphosphate-sugar epimerase [Paenibacillus uliginis N3/975]|uniref:Nucleoside-diphosphate-sugar epimerase n=1 Tax=Paenibacillus uliginis N3/975 TaxID=1313296 RepID=A0A1X7GCP9_9BACL|nr:NAD-dependent epimerase/dehydratase family protein [Paenibacillus uliginis]SMF67652.1 Nucleoside-diphosphate-sugar epimerase [Paenibacillus uliginis N3/975]
MLKKNHVNIAIIGATGHIAKNLIVGLSNERKYNLLLFARNHNKLNQFINCCVSNKKNISIHYFDNFLLGEFDVIINCIGIGNPTVLTQSYAHIFSITEEFDNLILEYLHKNTSTLYINFSSGAAYGADFYSPATVDKHALFSINNISTNDYYSIAKLNSEKKHRAYSNFSIIDLRIFGFFSRYIDLKNAYFMNDLLRSVRDGVKFITSSDDMFRDYIHPIDLLNIIQKCIELQTVNDVFDVYSLNPASKFEIVDLFKKTYNIEVQVQDVRFDSPTGNKLNYYSENYNLESIGYTPRYTSLETVSSETKAIFNLV